MNANPAESHKPSEETPDRTGEASGVPLDVSVSGGGSLRDLVENDPGVPMQLVQARTLKGFRDILPAEAMVKNTMLATLARVFESFGFVPIQTPHLEYTQCLFGDAGADIQKQVYRFRDNGDRDVALRFDLTVPFARFISQHYSTVGLPFKRWASGNVFRGENTQAGRYREFTQCDFDFVGTESLSSDAEVIQVIDSSLSALGLSNFQIRINNRKVMNGLAAAVGLQDRSAEILQEIDKLDKIGAEKVRQNLLESLRLPAESVATILEFVTGALSAKSNSEVFETLGKYKDRHSLIKEGLEELETVTRMVAQVGITDPRLKVDPSIARGLGYYTGIVYESILLDLPQLGSICSGGRYDNLTQTFRKEKCPGVGASVGLDRLMAGLEQLGLTPKVGTPAVCLIAVPNEDLRQPSFRIAHELREAGLNIEIYPDADKMKKQIAYARRANHPYLLQIRGDLIVIENLQKQTEEHEFALTSLTEVIDFLRAQ